MFNVYHHIWGVVSFRVVHPSHEVHNIEQRWAGERDPVPG